MSYRRWIFIFLPFYLVFTVTYCSCEKSSTPVTVVPDLYHCATGWFLLDWRCYRLFDKPASWPAAQLVCDRIGARLANIIDLYDNRWISALPNRYNGSAPPAALWFGSPFSARSASNIRRASQQWTTLDSDIAIFSGAWAVGEPDLRNGNCTKLVTNADIDGNWKAEACSSMLAFICEMPACPKFTQQCYGETKCISNDQVCDGIPDCESRSDEFNCSNPKTCTYHLTASDGFLSSPAHPGNYPANTSCLWLIEVPLGTDITLQFMEFSTEYLKDLVTVLGGSPLPSKSIALGTLSGKLDDWTQEYRSINGFLIILFSSDLSVEKSGFIATIKPAKVAVCGQISATADFQTINLPSTGSGYLGSLECIFYLTGTKGSLITIEILNQRLDVEDIVEIRNGPSGVSPLISSLSGDGVSTLDTDKVFQSTTNSMQIYLHTRGGLSLKIFNFRFAASCDLEFGNATGQFQTPGFDLTAYPRNQACSWRIKPRVMRSFTLNVTKLVLAPTDVLQIFEIGSNDSRSVFTNQNFTGSSIVLLVQSGEALIKLLSGPTGADSAFVVSYSVDCPALPTGGLVVLSTVSQVVGAEVTLSCPEGYELSSQAVSVTTTCQPGGTWSISRFPHCQPRYCGPAARYPFAVPVNVTAFTFSGTIDYKCLDGLVFDNNQGVNSIGCTANGTWTTLPACLPKRCPELLLPSVSVSHLMGKILIGTNSDFGSVISFVCQPGYSLSGAGAVVCRANGTWSDNPPTCKPHSCSRLPDIPNGFIQERQQANFFFGDTVTIDCLPGYRLRGAAILTCNINETFGDQLPVCDDIDECQDQRTCASDSTICVNVPGDHYCQCRTGYTGVPNCRQSVMFGIGAFRPEIYKVTVSGSVPEYDKGQIGLSSKGWCGSASKASDNWVEVDLKSPKVISAIRVLPVAGGKTTASVRSFTLTYRSLDLKKNILPGNMTAYTEPNGDPLILMVYPNSTSGTQLPVAIETQVIRVQLNDYNVGPCMRLDVIGCWKEFCMDVNECLVDNGKCDQICTNTPGSWQCGCNPGFQLYQANGTSQFPIPQNETGVQEGDVLLINKTCVPQSCSAVLPPLNGVLLNTQPVFRFGDMANFACQFGFEMVGQPSLKCMENSEWNDNQPLCIPAQCQNYHDDVRIGFQVDPRTQSIGLSRNVTLVCAGPEYRLPSTVMAGTRKCVFNRRSKEKSYWLTGRQPTCEMVDCGRPQVLPGSFYSNLSKTTYSASFRFACVAPFAISGESSLRDDVVRCTKHGIWDFGSLRCDGPTCSDPGRPADGVQLGTTYEESALVKFQCTKAGYALSDPNPIMCLRQADCGLIQPVGLSAGWIPDSALKGTSSIPGFELRNIRLSSSTGWCALPNNFTYAEMNLGRIYRLQAIRLKGILSDHHAGRVTQFRLFTKLESDDRYVPIEPDFHDNPRSYGALTLLRIPIPIRARYVAVGVLGFLGEPCMKMELYGCPAPNEEKAVVGWNATTPMCVDAEPPKFPFCPTSPVLVHKSASGKLEPVSYNIPMAVDNSGRIARKEVRPTDFVPGTVVFEDLDIEYTAFDADGNNATCIIQVRIVDQRPPVIACPKSYNITLDANSDSITVHFNTTNHPVEIVSGGQNQQIIYSPNHVKLLPNNYVNVTAIVSTDANNSSASCTFEVAALPFPCSDGGLNSPKHGSLDCHGSGKDGKIICTVTCNTGFVFANAVPPEYICDPRNGWSDTFVPDCVTEAGHDSVYDAAIAVLYMVTTPPTTDCVTQYSAYLLSQQGPVADMLSAKCSKSIDIPITVSPLQAIVLPSNASNLALEATFRFRVTPSRVTKSLFDLCSLTIDTLFDFSSPPTDSQMLNLARLVDSTDTCPNIEAIESNSTRGFTCNPGQVLVRSPSRMTCLECPRGTFAPSSAACVRCPAGTYQDGEGQTDCRACPVGLFTPLPGSKSVETCLPTCGSGTYSPNGVVPCLPCPRDTYSMALGAHSCSPCRVGTFTVTSASNGPEKCRLQCMPGEYSPTGLAPCTSCPVNYISLNPAARGCEQCRPEASTSDVNSTTCDEVACPVDYCLNGGQCEVANHRAICRCLPGFMGLQCQEGEDQCVSQPCFNGGLCTNNRDGYKCSCPAGFSGLQCEIDPKDCTSITCPNRGMCQNTVGSQSHTCLCRTGFAGAYCNETVNPCDSDVCLNGASCQRLQMDRFYCHCPPGFNGTYCENNIDDCSDNPCANGGTCTDLVYDFRCDCSTPFFGRYCEDKLDLCVSVNCHNGFCYEDLVSDITSPPVGRCVCAPGWTGGDCSVMVDNCIGQVCRNNGTCRSTADSFQCDCPSDYTGSQCQHRVDRCSGVQCGNGGTCSQDQGSFRCQCPVGISGTLCELNHDNCDPFPCAINSTDHCVDLVSNFTCVCLPGFAGRTCNSPANSCLVHRCLNGGTCRDTTDGYSCTCPVGWIGGRCERKQTACEPNPCHNDGLCFDVDIGGRSTFYCKCPPSYYGTVCSQSSDLCFGNPCLNSGTCVNTNVTELCQCGTGFSGPGCAFEVDSCLTGTCQNDLRRGNLFCSGDICDAYETKCLNANCPSESTCDTLRRNAVCQCPVNFAGEDCRKQAETDFDIRFYDETKSAGVTDILPFLLNTSSFSLSIWVQYQTPGDAGVFIQQYGANDFAQIAQFRSSNQRLIQITDSGATISLLPQINTVFVPFHPIFQVNDGGFHHIIFTWSGVDGGWMITVDSIKVDGGLNYGTGLRLPQYGVMVVGVGMDDRNDSKSKDVALGSGLRGMVSQVRVWNRTLDFMKEIPYLQTCNRGIDDGLLYRLSEVRVLNDKVEFVRPSRCFHPSLQRKKIEPTGAKLSCPTTKAVLAVQGYGNPTWQNPLPHDSLMSSSALVMTNIPSGRLLTTGRHSISYLQMENSTADLTLQQCHFNLYIQPHPCPELSAPIGGSIDCTDYGPDNRFRRCLASCQPGYDFSEHTPRIFTCESDAQWHPAFSSNLLRLPACAPVSSAQRIFSLAVAYTNVPCNDQTRQFLQTSIQRKVLELQLDWPTCLSSYCPGLSVTADCIPGRSKRQAGESIGVMMNVSFPAIDDPVRNLVSRELETVKTVMEDFAFLDRALDFQNHLPNAMPQPRDVEMTENLLCITGTVLKRGKCVTCAVGTFQNDSVCQRCPQGYYQDELGRSLCKICPAVNKRHSTTLTSGSVSQADCKELCLPGHYFNTSANQCLDCGFGAYQPTAGQFDCNSCPSHFTTTNATSIASTNCILDCPDGQDLSVETQQCQNCPFGTYRQRGQGPSCFPCPKNFSTRGNGSIHISDCSVPQCSAGSFFDEGASVCIICPFGFYQPKPQQTTCLQCPNDTTTIRYGADSLEKCVSTNKCVNGEVVCHPQAHCFKNGDGFKCICKAGYKGDGMEACEDMCSGYCFNQGRCSKDGKGNPYCECLNSFYGERCQSKSDTAYIAGGIAGAVVFVILLILLIWMICMRTKSPSALMDPTKVSPYGPGANSSGMLYSIEYPPSCSTATVRSHAAYVPYYETDDSWEMSGYSNTAFLHDGAGTIDKRAGRCVAPGKLPAKADPSAVYDIVHKYRTQGMKEIVPIVPPLDHPAGGGLQPGNDMEPAARL